MAKAVDRISLNYRPYFLSRSSASRAAIVGSASASPAAIACNSCCAPGVARCSRIVTARAARTQLDGGHTGSDCAHTASNAAGGPSRPAGQRNPQPHPDAMQRRSAFIAGAAKSADLRQRRRAEPG